MMPFHYRAMEPRRVELRFLACKASTLPLCYGPVCTNIIDVIWHLHLSKHLWTRVESNHPTIRARDRRHLGTCEPEIRCGRSPPRLFYATTHLRIYHDGKQTCRLRGPKAFVSTPLRNRTPVFRFGNEGECHYTNGV